MSGREFVINVHPKIPRGLARLKELSANLWYSWHRPTRALFGPLDPDLWDRVGHNPKLFLRCVDQSILEDAARDDVYLSNYHEALSAYDTYLAQTTRASVAEGFESDDLVAYFCAEYGLHESLPVYSGGLGILAGHHCKTASDMRLPFLAIGLFYRAGYFTQTLDDEGNQLANYVELDLDDLPITEAVGANGDEIRISVPFPDRDVWARVWLARAGHVHLFLLDTNVAENDIEDRRITHQLYGGGLDTRIQQEMILGIGGVRALRALGMAPTVWHLNEGHAAFSTFELTRELVAEGRDFHTALESVAASTVFTTHTPVPAGHDKFPPEMVLHYLAPMCTELGISEKQMLELGRTAHDGVEFDMTTLAINGSRHQNGVSRLHGKVSSAICSESWPQVPPEENPMGYITNGVHVPTVLAQDWMDLFDRVFGAEWRNYLCDDQYWAERIEGLAEHQFWAIRQTAKTHMLWTLQRVLRARCVRNQQSEPQVDRLLRHADPGDPNVLTVGFARRFATYKRATLLFTDLDRLRGIVNQADRPVVFVFAGKAHPADKPGQDQLRRVHEVSGMPDFAGKVLLAEGYDLGLARRLLSGVDVWLNTPVYTMEASGTSGMKAGLNGTINLSVTDGWWDEGYDGTNGWAIKPSPHVDDEPRRDREDANTLYDLLEEEVIPRYYNHGKYGYASDWVATAKRSMATILPRYNMNRVLEQYTEHMYVAAARSGRGLRAENFAGAETLARWRRRVVSEWPNVRLRSLGEAPHAIQFGEELAMEVAAELGGLAPDDVRLELLMTSEKSEPAAFASGGFLPDESRLDGPGERPEPGAGVAQFEPVGRLIDSSEHRYRLRIKPELCGRVRCQVRIYPHHALLTHPFETGLMVWLQ